MATKFLPLYQNDEVCINIITYRWSLPEYNDLGIKHKTIFNNVTTTSNQMV